MIRTYTLVGNNLKLFTAKRGKLYNAKHQAMNQAGSLPKFVGWSFDPVKRELYTEWTQAPTYLEEDELFDLFDEQFAVA